MQGMRRQGRRIWKVPIGVPSLCLKQRWRYRHAGRPQCSRAAQAYSSMMSGTLPVQAGIALRESCS